MPIGIASVWTNAIPTNQMLLFSPPRQLYPICSDVSDTTRGHCDMILQEIVGSMLEIQLYLEGGNYGPCT